MLATNRLKYSSCVHVHEYLLSSKISIAEATGDPFWGTDLGLQQTLNCLLDFWLGANHMGQILTEICSEIQNDHDHSDEKKWKAESPLTHDQPKSV